MKTINIPEHLQKKLDEYGISLTKEDINLIRDLPEMAEEIINDIIWGETIESFMKNPDEWVELAISDQNLFSKKYPKIMEVITKAAKKSQSLAIILPNTLRKIPSYFEQYSQEIEGLYGITKRKKIQERIDFIDFLCHRTHYDLAQSAIDDVRDELIEQQGYWKKLLSKEKGVLDTIFENEFNLKDGIYDAILKHIYYFGQNLEKYRDLYDKFDEEGFRNYFLPHLNSISQLHRATGETFNKIGKTDILIQDTNGQNVFIAECKLWKGESELNKAINQLLDRYVTWRDEKVAIIIFNKEHQTFTQLIHTAIDAVKKHKLCEAYSGQREQRTSFSYVFKHPEDYSKKILLELIVFNCI